MIDLRQLEISADSTEVAGKLFANLVFDLFELKYKNAQETWYVSSDSGIDALARVLPTGSCIIWQAKYFPNGLGNVQRQQIKQSFQKILDESEARHFKVDVWCLCLAHDLTVSEFQWWENWRKEKTMLTGITIILMLKADIENLLRAPEALKIRYNYFQTIANQSIQKNYGVKGLSILSALEKSDSSVPTFDSNSNNQFFNSMTIRKAIMPSKDRVQPVKKSHDISSKDWDIFICYKRLSGQDFAEALKKFLEECNLNAFLDIKDIPAQFKGTDKWFDSRDNAILNCRVFVLIMTAGFDLSDEVKKELTLARTVPGKLFTYFRHKDLKSVNQIILRNEILKIGDQQQHFFETVNELVRKAHTVLVENQNSSRTKE
jgi:hypothetical protein